MVSNNDFVKMLYDRNEELFRICNYHGISRPKAKDIIQDLYLKILTKPNEMINKYCIDLQPNMYIIFMILHNLIIDKIKLNNKYSFNEEIKDATDIIDETDYNFEIDDKYNLVINEINSIPYWFDRNIIMLYIHYNHTIRSLSKETKITFSTIQPIVQSFKNRCKSKFQQSKNLK